MNVLTSFVVYCFYGQIKRCITASLLILIAVPALSQINRYSIDVNIPAANYFLTPYLQGDSIVVHLQPKDAGAVELLIDARTGTEWSGSPLDLLKSYKRLGMVSHSDSVSGANQYETNILRLFGCGSNYQGCTSPLDANTLLFYSYDKASARLSFEVIEYSQVINGVTNLLNGKNSAATRWTPIEWAVAEAAASQAAQLAVWLEAIQGIQEISTVLNVRASVAEVRKVGGQALIKILDSETPTGIELKDELMLTLYKLATAQKAQAWLADSTTENAAALIKAIQLAIKPPNPQKNVSHIIASLFEFSISNRNKLTKLFSNQATITGSEVLSCFSGWIIGGNCKSISPRKETNAAPSGVQPAVDASASTAGKQSVSKKSGLPQFNSDSPEVTSRHIPPIYTETLPEITPSARSEGNASDAVSEFYQIDKGTPNKYRLFSFDESTGKLQHDTASIGGLIFVAKSVGATVKEGRFEVKITPSAQSPVRFLYGAYRVTVPIILRYTRETVCSGYSLCKLTGTNREELSQQRNVVFTLTSDNRWTNNQPTKFDHLTPFIADGAKSYEQKLIEVRMLVGSNIEVKMK